jgi:membrane protease subunit HflK
MRSNPGPAGDERSINEVSREYNTRSSPQPRAKKSTSVSVSFHGYRLKKASTRRELGDAARFTALFTEYEKAPEVTVRRSGFTLKRCSFARHRIED